MAKKLVLPAIPMIRAASGRETQAQHRGVPEPSDPATGVVPAPRSRQLAIKRLVDVVCALSALMLLFPVIASIAVLIRLDSRGPVISRRLRLGRNNIPFNMLTFRSMHESPCIEGGQRRPIPNDPRSTYIGSLLRRTRLDDLPQLWNVLVGDMALIGPCPHAPDMQAGGKSYTDLVDSYAIRHRMRPGMIGLAWSERLGDPPSRRMSVIRGIACDVDYVLNFSLALDLTILLRTARMEVFGGGRL